MTLKKTVPLSETTVDQWLRWGVRLILAAKGPSTTMEEVALVMSAAGDPPSRAANDRGTVALIREMDELPEERKQLILAKLQQRPPIYDTPIDNLCLSTRTHNVLFQNGVNTIGDIMKHTYVSLLRLRGMGRVSAREIDVRLRGRGLTLA